jgi:GMP synthase (glutamine-hydrolysing)
MKIHYLQHVEFETPANILKWAERKGHTISGTHLYKNENLPDLKDFDFLVIMGGPMGIYDEEDYPFLKEEKIFIKEAINGNKLVLGICLGAQLIADVLGSKVYKNKEKEIGWFDVKLTEELKKTKIFKNFPKKFKAFHWHGDTFDIPNGAIHIAESEACKNQAFEYNHGKVVALQFHLEVDKNAVKRLIENSEEELKEKGKYIQFPEKMLKNTQHFEEVENLLFKMLDNMENLGVD